MFAKTLIATVAFAALALAQSATVIVEASHGGAGNGLTNTTLTVPLDSPFTDPSLAAVSTLFLTAASGADVNSLTCTPFQNANGTGTGPLPFTFTTPSLLSTNTVAVGSIVCALDSGASLSSSAPSGTGGSGVTTTGGSSAPAASGKASGTSGTASPSGTGAANSASSLSWSAAGAILMGGLGLVLA